MRAAIAELTSSRIREVANAGIGRSDVLAFWFGESDAPTPQPIKDAAIASIQCGETYYSHNLGMPELREAIAAYASRLHRPVSAERVAVTSAGVSALMLAQQLLIDAGDEVVAVVPVWPNLTAQPLIMGATVRAVSLRPDAQGRWQLDLAELLAAITPATKMLVVNAPNNPTGWTLTRAEQQAVLDHCRRTGTWILADEVYERMVFGGAGEGLVVERDGRLSAPSFLDIAEPDDRLVVVHSFSKSFLMTGWRLGNLVAPAELVVQLGKLIEFNTSCAPVFVQRAGLAALAHADTSVPALQAHLRDCRDRLVAGLRELPQVTVATPPGAMYAFLRVDGQDDSLAFAKHLVREHGLGLAPGVAFGETGQGWLRWCFASADPARLQAGVGRLAQALRA
jgi:aspartate/methionine/tyrosine aminotransferase